MTSIIAAVFKATIGLLINKGRDKQSDTVIKFDNRDQNKLLANQTTS